MLSCSKTLVCLIYLCSTVGSAASEAAPLPALASSTAMVRVWLEPANNIVVTQQVKLNIEVSTPQWFTGGTQIALPEVDGLVILNREAFAVNSSRRIGGANWAVQLWSLSLYPQREAEFVVPAIRLTLSVADQDGQSIVGRLSTVPLRFSASVPSEISTGVNGIRDEWVASRRFKVTEKYTSLDGNELKVGSAVRRDIRVESQDVAAMMLPRSNFEAPEGIAVYADIPRLEDRINRGDYLAIRHDSVTYIVERAGEYELPSMEYAWYDLNRKQFRKITLPAKMLSTTEPFIAEPPNDEVVQEELSFWRKIDSYELRVGIVSVVLILLTAAVLVFFRRRQSQAIPISDLAKQIQRDFERQYRAGQYQSASASLFKWFDLLNHQPLGTNDGASVRKWLKCNNDHDTLQVFNRLMEQAHAASEMVEASTEVAMLIKNIKQNYALSDARIASGAGLQGSSQRQSQTLKGDSLDSMFRLN